MLHHPPPGSSNPPSGETALHVAAGAGFAEAIELLLSSGADATRIDTAGNLPIEHLPSRLARWKLQPKLQRGSSRPDARGGALGAALEKLREATMLASLCNGHLVECDEDGTERRMVYALLFRDRICRFVDDELSAPDPREHIDVATAQRAAIEYREDEAADVTHKYLQLTTFYKVGVPHDTPPFVVHHSDL